MTAKTDQRTAICMSTGGISGIYVLAGAWLACARRGIAPAWLGGASAGAVVAALWASGMPIEIALSILRDLKRSDLIRHHVSLTSLYDDEPVNAMLAELLPATFEQCSIPLYVGATRMRFPSTDDGQDDSIPEVIASGGLPSAVRASLSINGAWEYAYRDGHYYADAGYTVPYVLPHVEDYDRVLVFNPIRFKPYSDRDANIVSRLMWASEQLSDTLTREIRYRLQDYGPRVGWLDLDMGTSSMLDVYPEGIEAGYRATLSFLDGVDLGDHL